jgi:hypothetical protein
VQRLTQNRSRIFELYAGKVGERAAELEYEFSVNRLWISNAGYLALALGLLAEIFQSWVFGGLSILAAVIMLGIQARGFILRHRFFRAVSVELNTRVNFRHPVRGLPNWRKRLSDEQLQELDSRFAAWCAKRGLKSGAQHTDGH